MVAWWADSLVETMDECLGARWDLNWAEPMVVLKAVSKANPLVDCLGAYWAALMGDS